jgi:Spy/CpxP family protein refolding chaperone
MRRNTIAGIAAALLANLLVVTVSIAEPPFGRHPRGGGGGPGRMLDYHAERLDLDDETRAAIDQIVEESRAGGEDLRVELRAAHSRLRELLSGPSPDQGAVMRQAELIGEIETAERKHRLGSMLRIRELLTPEQREELVQIREEQRNRHFAMIEEACGSAMERFCPDLEPGPELGMCLRENQEELSDLCRMALERGPRRPDGRRGRRGPGRF